ncbi:MAG: hypothetical protein HQL87_05425 [Magnetococcales bacterium]|nr:hypothetical protein [Magnetococcales bacterium]
MSTAPDGMLIVEQDTPCAPTPEEAKHPNREKSWQSISPNGHLPFISSAFTLRDLLTVFFCDRHIIIKAFLVVFILFALASLQVSTKYTANASLLVLMSREFLSRPELGNATPNMSAINPNQIVRTEIEILTNPMLIREVATNLGVDMLYPGLGQPAEAPKDPPTWGLGRLSAWWQARHPSENQTVAEKQRLAVAVERLQKGLEIQSVKDTDVIQLKFTHTDPETASDVLNTLIYAYMEYRQTVLNQKRSPLVTEQLEGFRARLEQAQINLNRFKTQHGITAFGEQKNLLVHQEMELRTSLLNTSIRLEEATGRTASLRASLQAAPATVTLLREASQRNPTQDKLAELQLRRDELRTKFVDTSHFVTDLDQQIAQMEKALHTDARTLTTVTTNRDGSNPVHEQIQTELARATAELQSLQNRQRSETAALARLTQELHDFDHLEHEYTKLATIYDQLEQNIKSYAQKAEELKILEEMDRQKNANVRIIEQATPPIIGRSIRTLLLLLGTFAGLFVGILTGLIRDYTRDTLISPESAERLLGMPVLVAIARKGSLVALRANPIATRTA